MHMNFLKIIPALLLVVHLNGEETPPEFEFISAVHQNKLSAVKEELKKGIDINVKTPDGSNAGHAAADTCNLPMLKFLASKGLKLHEPNSRGDSALAMALSKAGFFIALADRKPYNNCEKFADYLITKLPAGFFAQEEKSELLNRAVGSSYVNLVQKLLKKGALVDYQDKNGTSPLMNAVKPVTFEAVPRNIKIVKMLLKHKANKGLKNKDGQTAYDILNTDENPDKKLQSALLKLLTPE